MNCRGDSIVAYNYKPLKQSSNLPSGVGEISGLVRRRGREQANGLQRVGAKAKFRQVVPNGYSRYRVRI